MTSPAFVIDTPNPDDHLETEWLLTNGCGGYAMGTVLGVNTRRYHGLLVAATQPPVKRMVVLHSMIEQVVIPRDDGGEEVIDLSTQMFVGPDCEPMLHPDGWTRLKSFECEPGRAVTWHWQAGDLCISKHMIAGLHHEPFNSTHVLYRVTGKLPNGASLRVRPLVSMRSAHALTRLGHVPPTILKEPRGVVVRTDDGSFLIANPHAQWMDALQWWEHFALSEERHRGMPWVEDVWSPGVFETSISDNGTILAHFTIAQMPHWDLPSKCDSSDGEEDELTGATPGSIEDTLKVASSAFVVTRSSDFDSDTSIIAGYPWFADWGRDAMIALPGLLLVTERYTEAKKVLETFAATMRNGLIPNRFADDGGEPEYNTVDASLWFVYAVWQWWKAVEARRPSHLLNACRAVLNAYRNGTDFGIRLDPRDHLITAGDATTQLTWMDAKRDGHVFTPRHGKAVEINALWHNALLCLAGMTDDEAEATDCRDLATRTADSFRNHFWWPEHHCLHDVLDQDTLTGDGRLRPNQIFAVSLPHSPLSRDQQRHVVACVKQRFLTPFGLRTLDRDDPDYQPRYEGDMWQRDSAYHNGTVWPWLIGPYCEAIMRAGDWSSESMTEARGCIQPLLDEMHRTTGRTCLGQIAEIYDGDPPHTPDGCPAQAWSVAEVMRILAITHPQSRRQPDNAPFHV